jgi:hypothetical protein
MSKRDTPLVEADAAAILGMTADEVRAAAAAGRLGRSIRLADDPTHRLAFHNFWDLVEFSLASGADVGPAAGEARRRLAADLCDHLAEGAEDLAVGTGNEDADFLGVCRGWIEEEGDGLPAGVVGCYLRLLLRTLGVLHAAAVGEAGGLAVPSGEEGGVGAEGVPFHAAA